MKVLSFFQQGSRSMCILSATGVISSVTFHQTDTSGGKVTFEGRYDLLTLAGSFVHSETGGTRNLSGGMSVSLISPEGRVIGGRIDGQLVAASPVQWVAPTDSPCFLYSELHHPPVRITASMFFISSMNLVCFRAVNYGFLDVVHILLKFMVVDRCLQP
ncbi:hypothetical protein KY284_027260 [Solanum tuberosum]|nr:hypothetical protein KY284_027260 [Solanum tuberosum]